MICSISLTVILEINITYLAYVLALIFGKFKVIAINIVSELLI